MSASASSSLLDDVLAGYLGSLTERELDGAFRALLLAAGYWDVHFTHGNTEFGKDFIAKGYEGDQICQYMFQTKVGDLGSPEWRTVRTQIDEMRWNPLSHPNFDPNLPRRPHLVTTGRLVGNAPIDAQQYKAHLEQNNETTFDLWQGEDLVRRFADAPEAGLAREPVGPLFGVLSRIEEGDLTEQQLEIFSRTWARDQDDTRLLRAALQAFIIAHNLLTADRIDLSILTGCHLVRAAWKVHHGSEPVSSIALTVADLGRNIVLRYGGFLLERYGGATSLDLVHLADEVSAPISYPVRCVRLLELIGLYGLATEDPERSDMAAGACSHLMSIHPGAAHPVSDHWAASLVPAAILVGRRDPTTVRDWLGQVAAWVADHYEYPGLGLAPTWSNPDVEIAYLLGDAYEHVELERYPFSFCATVILDLIAAMELGDLYDDVVNDFVAVDLCPFVVEADDTTAQYSFDDDSDGLHVEVNAQYVESWAASADWRVAPHHVRAGPVYLMRINRPWDLLAIGSALRDRHLPLLTRRLLGIE